VDLKYSRESVNVQDGTVKIWDTVLGTALYTLSGHERSVTCVRWGGTDLIYTSSQDSTIKVWRADDVSFLIYSCLLHMLSWFWSILVAVAIVKG